MYLTLPSDSLQLPPEQVQIGQSHQQVPPPQTPVTGLLKAKLLFDYQENALQVDSNRGLFSVALFLAGRQALTGFTPVIDAPAETQMPSSTPAFITGITHIHKDDAITISQQLRQFSDVSDMGDR